MNPSLCVAALMTAHASLLGTSGSPADGACVQLAFSQTLGTPVWDPWGRT